MFTGLISEVGTVAAIDRDGAGARVRIAAGLGGELEPGDSVAVSGACLTAVELINPAMPATVEAAAIVLKGGAQ